MFEKLKNLISVSWDVTSLQRAQTVLFILVFISAYAVDLLAPVCLGFALRELAQKDLSVEGTDKALLFILGYVIIRIFVVSAHHFARIIQLRTGLEAKLESLQRLLTACLLYPLKWHLKRHSGENLNRIHRASASIEAVIATYIWQVIDGLVKVVFAASAIAFLNFKVVLIVILTSALSVYFMLFFNKRLLDFVKAMNFFWDRANKLLVDTLTNIVSVKMLGLEEALSERISRFRPQGSNIYKKLSRFMELKWGSIGIGFAIMSGLSIVVYVLDLKSRGNQIDIALIYILLDYLNRINQAISGFTGYYGGLLESATNFEEGYDILSNVPATQNKDLLNDGLPLAWNKIKINRLSFRYSIADLAGIECENFDFSNGEKIAIVGPSGSGKSTFMRCLAGLVEPQISKIFIDTKEVDLKAINSISLLVPQEPELFSDTIHFNLVFNRDVPEQVITQALRIAEIDELINRLPQGLNTDLAHHGLSISVGEKQRLALARGLIMAHNYEILLLDEPTSSVDATTEREIFANILACFATKTVFCTLHRLGLIPLFDKIIVIKNGHMVEYGTFRDLISIRGEFFRLWTDFTQIDTEVVLS
ncbi:MAG: ABC transporter ATP-binding protein/permease [Deltaproteobacteria bacterium]|nr:ABC transporter ATP-binding protein/permease [Deltaproteobacteria bacterium]